LGIQDRGTGIERARASRRRLQDAAQEALGRTDALENGHILVMGLATRAAGLHDGIVHALETDNPFAAYTMLRSYAENAAAVLYAIGHPKQLDRILGLGNSYPLKVGTITNYAEQGSKRFGAFQDIYGQLSQFAHPMSKSIFASTAPTETGFQWRLDPAFKYDNDFIVACAWVVELAEAKRTFWWNTQTLKAGARTAAEGIGRSQRRRTDRPAGYRYTATACSAARFSWRLPCKGSS
jgi:hypothetical protein